MKNKLRAGFSLVEILVAISIILLFTIVILTIYLTALPRARDAQRKEDLQRVAFALEIYHQENGQYPLPCAAANPWAGPGPHSAHWGAQCDNDWIDGLAPTYLPELPTDPALEDVDNVGYLYMSDGDDYALLSHQAVENQVTSDSDPFQRYPAWAGCTSSQPETYAVYSPGAAEKCW